MATFFAHQDDVAGTHPTAQSDPICTFAAPSCKMDQNKPENRPEMVHSARTVRETCRMDQNFLSRMSGNAQSRGNHSNGKNKFPVAPSRRVCPPPQRITPTSTPLSQRAGSPRFLTSPAPITANNARPGIPQDGRQPITRAILCRQSLKGLPHSRCFTFALAPCRARDL